MIVRERRGLESLRKTLPSVHGGPVGQPAESAIVITQHAMHAIEVALRVLDTPDLRRICRTRQNDRRDTQAETQRPPRERQTRSGRKREPQAWTRRRRRVAPN